MFYFLNCYHNHKKFQIYLFRGTFLNNISVNQKYHWIIFREFRVKAMARTVDFGIC